MVPMSKVILDCLIVLSFWFKIAFRLRRADAAKLALGYRSEHLVPLNSQLLLRCSDAVLLWQCYITIGGALKCVGRNDRGQLSDGSTDSRSSLLLTNAMMPTFYAVSNSPSLLVRIALVFDLVCAF